MLLVVFASIFLLAFCVFFHELGHYLFGRFVGIQARVFSVGYGRALFFKKIGKTIFQVGKIPLGGYVQFYGDNPSKELSYKRAGYFYFAAPWKRILVAFGGPFFSVLLAVIVFCILILFGWRPMTNQIHVRVDSPAEKLGLISGDKILFVDKKEISSFKQIVYYFSFSEDEQISLDIERDNKMMTFYTRKPMGNLQSSFFRLGIEPFGSRYLENYRDVTFSNGNSLLKGDVIYKVNGEKVFTISELQNILTPYIDLEVELEIERKESNIFVNQRKMYKVMAPVQNSHYITFSEVLDLQTGQVMDDFQVSSWSKIEYKRFRFDGKEMGSFEELIGTIKKKYSGTIEFFLGPLRLRANASVQRKPLLGISLTSRVEPELTELLETDISSTFSLLLEETYFASQATLVGLWLLIKGKISFTENVSGPAKIVYIASKTVDLNWWSYWILLANITLVLGIMNLLPIPVLDGGHIIFFLIEWIYKPVNPKVVEKISRVFIGFLIMMGVYVLFLDFYDIFKNLFYHK